jgi:hypothetical protein
MQVETERHEDNELSTKRYTEPRVRRDIGSGSQAPSWGASAHRGWTSRQGEAGDLGQRVAVKAQDIDIAIDKIADIEKAAVGTERDPLGEITDFGSRHLAYGFAVDFQQRHIVLLCHKHCCHLNKLIFFKMEALKLMNQFNDIKIL